jgi:hypothetical protein
LLELKPFVSQEIHKEWEGVLLALENRIKSNMLSDDVKPVLIAHKILKQELSRLVEIG